jgi:hypothetical protein
MSVGLLRTQSQFSNHSSIGWSLTVPRGSAFGNLLTGTRSILGPQWVDTCRMPTFASNPDDNHNITKYNLCKITLRND